MPDPRPDPPKPAPKIGMGFAVIGSELASMTLAGVAVDYFTGNSPWFTVGFTVLGCVAAVLLTVRLLKLDNAAQKSRAGPPG